MKQSKDEGSHMSSDETALDTLLDDDLSEVVDLHLLEKQRRWMYDTPSLLNTQQVKLIDFIFKNIEFIY